MKIKSDSRKIKKGDIFIALKTINNDGHNYIDDAIKNGATTVITEKGLTEVETIIVPDTRVFLEEYLKREYGYLIESLSIVGITGTNGKTTTCFLLHQALNKLGLKCSYIGTIGFYIDKKIRDLSNTTPDILELYEMFLESYDSGCKYVVMEVSSQAISMKRIQGIKYDYAVFTNLTEDHLDYHSTMENYALAKQNLFKNLKPEGIALVNVDNQYFQNFLLPNNNNLTYGFSDSDYKIINYKLNGNINNFIIDDGIETEYNTKILGKYNIYNVSVVIIILTELGIDKNVIKKIIQELKSPIGRMDVIIYGDNKIIIDYAHTPDAVENILKTVKEMESSNIYTIIGCGGNRDKAKRPIMGSIATSLSTHVIFTSDNPRNEDPNEIVNDIVKNLTINNYEIEIDRTKAIKKGIQKLKNNDILLVLGKGHETYQIIGENRIHFDDREKVLDIIRR
ncbi:MAG: UDP-N-acetylmuramoyl-L-alanyl-D-glutamate--2,6-diaminopimelate ligase [Bacilli bacterium]|nr:UDP-N-acetylmuramoyl-L-alanyl-D-glutamate--2,6-diaminopimelate ligase [Bacilli bacterium]MDD4282960.1 UDP-N-acetylmuramoyl-L-alanyl-D-glutamate--2,6-diaminopimelate ligase [Bacilli bacterium]